MQRSRVQHAAGVTQAYHAVAIQNVRVDAGDLRRCVCTQPEQTPARLIGQFERAQIEVVAGTRMQRIRVLDQRRNDELVPVAAIQIEQCTTQLLDPARFVRQHVGYVFRQQPARHGDARLPGWASRNDQGVSQELGRLTLQPEQ